MEDEERVGPAEDGAGDAEAQLAAARAEIARLQGEASQAAARAAEAYAEGEVLREQLRAASDAGAGASAEAERLRGELDTVAERERASAARYRDLVVRSEPSLPAELIAGESIDAVDRSLEAAREIVGRVRTHIEQQAQAVRVPAGAPPRSGPDLSAMSPEQKIRYGLGQRRA
ncbi:MAG: hypothetical protein KGK07_11315 [Chloroflexota bacterium]|nr:hypothetical protein [Chloroflexota bacterium]